MKQLLILLFCWTTTVFSQDQLYTVKSARTTLFGENNELSTESVAFFETINYSNFRSKDTYLNFLKSIDYRLAKKGKEETYARLHYHIAERYIQESSFLDAYEHAFQAEYLLNKSKVVNKNLAASISASLARIYYQFYYYDEAKHLFLQSMNLNKKDDLLQIKNVNALGLVYSSIDKDSSLFYFKLGIQICRKIKSTIWEPIIFGNIGKIYAELGDTSKAITYFELDREQSLKNLQLESSFAANEYLFNIYAKQQNLSALKSAFEFYDKLDILFIKDQFLYSYLVHSAIYHGLNSNFQKAFESRQKADRIYQRFSSKINKDDSNFKKTILSINIEKTEAEKQVLNVVKQSAENRMMFTIILSIIIISSLIYYFTQRGLKRKKNEEHLLLQAQYIQQELEAKENTLKDTLHALSEKARMLEKVENEIKNDIEISTVEQSRIIEKLQSFKLNTDEDLIEFKRSFEKIHPGFNEYLIAKYPDITNAELRLASLLKLKYDSLEMSNLLGISVSSVRKTNLRLRKRLDIELQSDLLEYIKNIPNAR